MAKNEEQFNLRVSKELKAFIKKKASDAERSMNYMIAKRLEQWMKQEQQGG